MVSGNLFCILGMVIFVIGGTVSENDNRTNVRQKRLFSIFNIVTFKNEACTSTGAGNDGGTCLTSGECTSKGGSASGNCAAGFGVCCVFSVSGECASSQTISQNCTYIRNNGYPSADTTVSETCEYQFDRICDNLCQIRLDFNSLVSVAGADGSCVDVTSDTITVASPFSTSQNAFPPAVCGTLSGQHSQQSSCINRVSPNPQNNVWLDPGKAKFKHFSYLDVVLYLETGTTGTAGALSIAKGTTAGNRNFEIKVTYYTCNNLAKAPAGCTQYFTGESGSFQSYNYQGNQLLQSMNYNNCFRREEGFCRLQISEASTMTPDPFILSDDRDKDDDVDATLLDCAALSYVAFTTPTNTMFCGETLSSKAGDTVPGVLTSAPGDSFLVGLRTLGTALADLTGFNLNYKQVACP